jgi:hypothetical protein
MANIGEARKAAEKRPSARTPAERRMVEDNKGDQQVRNNDHAAKEEERVYGPAKS